MAGVALVDGAGHRIRCAGARAIPARRGREYLCSRTVGAAAIRADPGADADADALLGRDDACRRRALCHGSRMAGPHVPASATPHLDDRWGTAPGGVVACAN